MIKKNKKKKTQTTANINLSLLVLDANIQSYCSQDFLQRYFNFLKISDDYEQRVF